MAAAVRSGRAVNEIEADALATLRQAGFAPDYAVIRRQDDLGEPAASDGRRVALIAARLGATRLIDNFIIDL